MDVSTGGTVDRDEEFLGALAVELSTAASGVSFVYRALDALVQRYNLRDAIIVIDHVPIGRQAFRAGRRPLPVMGGPGAVTA